MAIESVGESVWESAQASMQSHILDVVGDAMLDIVRYEVWGVAGGSVWNATGESVARAVCNATAEDMQHGD